jgi:hypothetical protein
MIRMTVLTLIGVMFTTTWFASVAFACNCAGP